MKDPYKIVKARYVTEKAEMLGKLHMAENNPSLARCKSPKYVFEVSPCANKHEIATAIEEIYREQKVVVSKVNTLWVKPKPKRQRGKGRPGFAPAFKKAIVTMQPGDVLV